ncbi:hypothetical protein IPH70_00460 [Candidatus Roizmanbacteria bacterium]|nr:MAG: hypothetical protein IPH70_00460 [Candidatus Roizmanbacteria bacterium]
MSIPFVPPEIVLVAPNAVVEEPKSPAKVIVELSSSPFEIEVPSVVTSVLPAALSPVPVKSVMVSPPTVSDPAETEPEIVTLPALVTVNTSVPPNCSRVRRFEV